MKLDSIRDMWTNTYTYFWRDSSGKLTSPYFDSEKEAEEWLEKNLIDGGAMVSTGVDSSDGNTVDDDRKSHK
jgi:hypothetical protein